MYTPVGFETEAVQFQDRTSRNVHVSSCEAVQFQDHVVEGFHMLDIFQKTFVEICCRPSVILHKQAC